MSEERERVLKRDEGEVEGHAFRRVVEEDAQPTPESADPQVRSEGEDEGPEVEGHKVLKT